MKERRRATPAGRGLAPMTGAGVLLALSAVPARAVAVSYATE
ncbi:hypothetical protein [Streptomyces sp. NPDC005017]